MNLIEKNHLGNPSKINLRNTLCIIVAVGIVGGIITSASHIMDAVWLLSPKNAESISIPPFSVKLNNNGSETISLPTQGQCFLWPPEPHDWDYEGGYEFKLADGTDIDPEVVAVPAKGERAVQIHLKRIALIHQTKTSLARFFSTGDWHVQFNIITDQNGRNQISSARIPFTVEAMSRSYVFEVSKEPFQRKVLN